MASKQSSNFIRVQDLLNTDDMTIIRDGVNNIVSWSAAATALGVTGTIVNTSGGTPVLYQPTSTTNIIRSITSGAGVNASLNASNGITLKHNFAFDGAGEALCDNPTNINPTMKSIVAGDNMTISTVGNTIVFDSAASLGTDVVPISEESDFPAAVAGVITLLADTVYVMVKATTTANRFALQNNTTFFGYNAFGPLLTYSGTGTMFTSVDANVAVNDMHLAAPNGKVFDISSTTGAHIAAVRNINIMACAAAGTFTGMLSTAIDNVFGVSATAGFNFTGTGWNLISVIDVGFISASASFIGVDLGTCVANNINIKGCIFIGPAGAIGVKGAASNANLVATGRGEISGLSFIGDITELSGIDISADTQWLSKNNQGIIDTDPDSLSYNTAGVTVTISGINTPTLIAGTWVDVSSQHFTVNGTGRVTYNGSENMGAPISLTVTADPASGSAKDFRVYIAINGTEITASGVPARASASDRAPVTVIWQHEFATNDYVEAFIANETDAVDFDVIHAVMRVN